MLAVLVALSVLIAHSAAQYCLPEILCIYNGTDDVCNTDESVLCDPMSPNITHDCPCQCTEQCDDPADVGEFCQVRDCWANACMSMDIGQLVCNSFDEDGDPCSVTMCESNVNESTYQCTDPMLRFVGCCKMAETDCAPDAWNGVQPQCTQAICDNYNATVGYGECALVNETGACCTSNADCIDPDNLCMKSTCENMTDASMYNESTGVCSDPVLLDCSGSSGPTLCDVGRCNASSGTCYTEVLNETHCPGACCTNATDSGCSYSSDKAWCDFVDGYFMMGVNCTPGLCNTQEPTQEPTLEPTAEPTLEPTREPTAEPTLEPTAEPTLEPTLEPTREPTAEPTLEPTAEPTLEPTLEPTAEPTLEPTLEPTAEPTLEPTAQPSPMPTPEPTGACTTNASCASDPTTKCLMPYCNLTNGMDSGVCEYLNKTEMVCHDMRPPSIANNSCYMDMCDYLTGICHWQRDYSCCTASSTAHCYNPGGACHYAVCENIDMNGYGTCGVVVNYTNCCESNTNCTGGNLCSTAYCDHVSDTCVNVNATKQCPETYDLCTDPYCDPMTGVCGTTLSPNQHKCARACCFGNGTCTNVDFFNCSEFGGTYFANNTCETIQCPTPAPTSSPTPAPTTPAPTADPCAYCPLNPVTTPCGSVLCSGFCSSGGGACTNIGGLCGGFGTCVRRCGSSTQITCSTNETCACLCRSLSSVASCTVQPDPPTPAPTSAPTPAPTPAPTLAPTPAPTVAFTGSCCVTCSFPNATYCVQPSANSSECTAARNSIKTNNGHASCTNAFDTTTCKTRDDNQQCSVVSVGCCDDNYVGGSQCANVENTNYCVGTVTPGTVCCTNGTCAADSTACGGPAFASFTPAPPLSTMVTTLVAIPPELAAYSHTLCRVLHDCGDGDEQACIEAGEEELVPCTGLGCCDVIDIP